MKLIDFARSFLTFRIDTEKKPPKTVSHEPPYSLNNARIQLECRCSITDKASGATQAFVLGTSCKTERVGVESDIWTEPNADFVPIFSLDRFINFKTFARAGTEVDLYPPGSGSQSDRQTGDVAETFDDFRIDIVEVAAERLDSANSIVEATLANQPLVARTTLDSEQLTAVIEYPIKTMNANERDDVYQTDTGPMLLPALDGPFENIIERFELAFAAFNCPHWIELIVRQRTTIAEGVQVYHYSESVRLESRNEVWRILT